MHFTFRNPTQIQFGQGQIASVSSLIPKQAKVLLLYGSGSVKRNGVYDQAVNALADHQWQEFSGIEANPTVETLDRAVDLAKSNGTDYILAVGGGSVIDGAKYVAAASRYDGDGWDILEQKHTVKDAIPLGVVLTLPATGSESNANSVVSKSETQQKLGFASPFVLPTFAIMDPDVIKTLPHRQLVNGIVDAWVHVCEQYLTYPTGALIQDGYALTLLKTLKTLGDTIEHQDDAWRANLMWSANQALNGLVGAGVPQDWATHMIGHELTALYGVDHARSLAIIQPWLLRNQIDSKRAKLDQMGAEVFSLTQGENLAERTIDEIERFYHQLDVATQLTDYGSSQAEAIEQLIARLEKHGMRKLGENKAVTLEQSRLILSSAVAA